MERFEAAQQRLIGWCCRHISNVTGTVFIPNIEKRLFLPNTASSTVCLLVPLCHE